LCHEWLAVLLNVDHDPKEDPEMLQYKEGYASAVGAGCTAESPAAEAVNTVTFLSTEEHPELFRLLAKDDGFRAELQADPRSALAKHRIHVDPEMIPDKVRLPEKELFLTDEGQRLWLGLMA
jgi:hypothetical protein